MSPIIHTTDAKAIATIAARLALEGHELHAIQKHGCVHFEVRHKGQCRTASTLHGVIGILAAMAEGSLP